MLESEEKTYQEKLDKMTDVRLLDELLRVYNLARSITTTVWLRNYDLACEKLVRKEILKRMSNKPDYPKRFRY